MDIVELAEADELRLTAKELDRALTAQAVAVLDLDVLLGRHRHEHQSPTELIQDASLVQGPRGPQHHADLGMVATGMGRARLRVGVGVVVHDEGVQLADDS